MTKSFLNFGIATLFTVLSVSSAYAGPFDFMNQDKKTETKSNAPAGDLDKMSQRGTSLIKTVSKATIHFSDAAIKILEGLGKKEDAERLKAMTAELKTKENDPEGIKKIMASDESQKAIESIGKIDINSKTKINLSNQDLLDSFVKLSSGIIVDGDAVIGSAQLVKEAMGMVESVKSDPMKYGFSALGTVNSVIGSGKFIGDTVPKQVSHVKNFSDKLIAYFKTNKISVPSADTIKKAASTMTKG